MSLNFALLVTGPAYGTQTASAKGTQATAAQPAASDTGSWIQSIGNLFN